MNHEALREAIIGSGGITGLLIADSNGLLIKAHGDFKSKDPKIAQKVAGRLTQVVKIATGLSDTGAERVSVVIETASDRHVVASKAQDLYYAASSKPR